MVVHVSIVETEV